MAPLVKLDREVSESFGAGIFCKASIVAEGGVFSPRIAFGGGLEFLKLSCRLGVGVAVPDRVPPFSGDRASRSDAGVRSSLSGDLSGDLAGERSRDPKTST